MSAVFRESDPGMVFGHIANYVLPPPAPPGKKKFVSILNQIICS